MAVGPGIGAVIALSGLGWIGGVALQLQQPSVWHAAGYGAVLAGAFVLAAGASLRRLPRRPAVALQVVAIALAGFASTGWRALERLADELPPALEGQDLVVTGVVAKMPEVGPAGLRFAFDVDEARLRGQAVRVPRRLWLGWYGGFDADALLAGPERALRAGQRWTLPVRLRAPHGSVNPHGFDLELWLFEQGIRASGHVRAVPGAMVVRHADGVAHPVERLRQHVRDAILLHVNDARAAGVLAALAVGDQGAIEREDWDLFRATGIAHLMSISGLHVTMFAWLAAALIGRLWRLHGPLMLRLPAPHAARWGGVAAAAGYALVAGWGIPAQRTVWMLATVALLRSLGLRWPALLVLLAAAVVVTLADPWALLQPGFWLSFAAVGLLSASQPVQSPSRPRADTVAARLGTAVRDGLRTQAVATLGLSPLTLAFFGQVSVVGFAANLFAIPLVTLIVTPLALLGIALPWLWQPAALAVQGLAAALEGLAAWPLAQWNAAAAPAWAVLAGLLGGALLVLPLPWRLRLLGLPLLLPLAAPVPARPADGQFEAVVADVGQGTAVLVRTRTHLLVYDAGPQYSPEADAGQRVLLPLLRARGEARIDLLMLSHRDTDHVGGAASLLAHVEVAELRSSLDAAHPLRRRAVPQRRCEAGQRWQWDGVRFEVLHPRGDDVASERRANALSCVLRIVDAAGRGLLLTGDIEAAQEAALLARDRDALRSEVLLVPHHGSRGSSTADFIDAVAPQVAVVQAGYRSRFGHPAPEVVQRLSERGVVVQRTDRCGAWLRAVDGGGTCERARSLRYWRWRPAPETTEDPR